VKKYSLELGLARLQLVDGIRRLID